MSGGFAWALPDDDQEFKLPSGKKSGPIANPLLKTRGPVFTEAAYTGQNASRAPLASMHGNELRHRTNTNKKAPVLPPKASLTLDGGGGIWTSNDIEQDSPQTPPELDSGVASPPPKSNDLDRWIVITGLPEPPDSGEEILTLVQRLESLGNVVNRRRGGNWMALEYGKALSAEKACCQGPWVLKRNHVVQVVRLTLNLQAQLDWSPVSSWVRRGGSAGRREEVPNGSNVLLSEERSSAMVRNGAGKSSCQIIMEFLFGWDDAT